MNMMPVTHPVIARASCRSREEHSDVAGRGSLIGAGAGSGSVSELDI